MLPVIEDQLFIKYTRRRIADTLTLARQAPGDFPIRCIQRQPFAIFFLIPIKNNQIFIDHGRRTKSMSFGNARQLPRPYRTSIQRICRYGHGLLRAPGEIDLLIVQCWRGGSHRIKFMVLIYGIGNAVLPERGAVFRIYTNRNTGTTALVTTQKENTMARHNGRPMSSGRQLDVPFEIRFRPLCGNLNI